MQQINKREREAILTRFPKADIVSTRHRYFLAGYATTAPARFLAVLRGQTPPPSRKDKARGIFSRNNNT